MTEVVSFRNVGVRYESGPEILRDLNFALHRGSFHFLTGASGAGKSTLMRLLYLALRQTRGEISIFGRDNIRIPRDELPAIRRKIGVVFQDFRLINHLSTFENVALQQRVAIARAVIGRPALLLADEPTGNVDDRIAMRLLYLFEELNKLGTTVLIATHNRQLVRKFGHNQWLLEAGTLHDITHST